MTIVAKTTVHFGTKEKYETAFPYFDYTGYLIDNRIMDVAAPGELDTTTWTVIRYWRDREVAEKYLEWAKTTMALSPVTAEYTIEDYTE